MGPLHEVIARLDHALRLERRWCRENGVTIPAGFDVQSILSTDNRDCPVQLNVQLALELADARQAQAHAERQRAWAIDRHAVLGRAHGEAVARAQRAELSHAALVARIRSGDPVDIDGEDVADPLDELPEVWAAPLRIARASASGEA